MNARLEKTDLTLGFVALTDCALLAVAKETGLFEAEGLDVHLSRDVSWANIRDKVAGGALDGAHMLAPMALALTLGVGGEAVPMITPLSLNANGSSISLSAAVAEAVQVLDPAAAERTPRTAHVLKRLIDARKAAGERPLTFAVVFPYSLHNYMLRYWLAEAGVDPDRDVRITVTPPPRMAARLAAGEVDGVCVGAPWGGAVEASGAGRMVLHGGEFWPGAPDKVLGVTAAWAKAHPETLKAVLRALVRASSWAESNEDAVAALLARPHYLDTPRQTLGRALSHANPFGIRFIDGGAGRPRPEHALWLLSQMRRWGQVESAPGQEAAARAVYSPDLYREAVSATGVSVPEPGPFGALFDGTTPAQ